ncbi:deoxyguanosinetriphosphate triphosphohydrolase [Sphingorhabdus sp. Alg239-R122]|uniref:deoxyguanosinetriphosphate triphosphohydrolase n=1 Tax=Sphingorhabdus sp. Alg239-R122 TaxID=2305989 RepID=UPI0013DD314E|nr:deoxyguanosinetriphosphate triphosphohydrolase [Sphingorhabdus sp. Alg239-R122]
MDNNIIRASYASNPHHSRGRQHQEETDVVRGTRSVFQRDRDRIIHSISFRRLRHKTQVFVAPDGDHYRVRLTHSLEVAQIGRTIARTLGLDEDLTEALCLAHDIGHPPFGHAGEDALQDAMTSHGGFDHNAQTLRTLMQLESPYPNWRGLNLSWEVLEGLAKHNGPVHEPNWALAEINAAFDLALGKWPSLEAQVAAIADDIAYDNHDIDDGVRAGFLSLEQLLELPFIARQWEAVSEQYPDASEDMRLRELVRSQIGLMVNDVVTATKERLEKCSVKTADDARDADLMIAGFSDTMALKERALKKFMYFNLYFHPEQKAAADKARVVVAKLMDHYTQNPESLPDDWKVRLPDEEPYKSRHIADFVAGMTDRYALRECIKWTGSAPEGLSNV